MIASIQRLALFGTLAVVANSAGAETKTLQVGVGQQQLLQLEQRVERVAVGDPEIAAVNVLKIREVLVTGKKRGDTSLLIWPRGADEPMRYSVVVGTDLPGLLQSDKRKTLRTQVQTDIKIAEVSRRALRQIGFSFLNNPPVGESAGRLAPPGVGGGFENPDGDNFTLLSDTAFEPIGDAFNLLLTDSDKDAVGLLSILERRGLMRTLAEPSLVAMSGQTATFLAGGEFPIPVAQGGGEDSITIEFKEFGIRLALTPTVLQEDRVVLKVAPEVSELDFDAGITSQGIRVPGINVRRTDTTVELGDGETFIISGLVDQDLSANVDKVPWLGDIPILGTFFRSTSFDRQDRELIMIVTPHLVTPLAKGTKVPLPGEEYENYNPDSTELFFFETGEFSPEGRSSTGFTR